MTDKSLSLQSAFQELEEISDYLNSQDLDLEQALEKFKRGQELIKYCQQQIQQVENEFVQITKDMETEDINS